ncbi:MAG: hypothetical protein ABIQ59_01035 [Nocardioidaceae bacterium]
MITILCTTVGETFADYLKDTSGFGPDNTAILMTAALIVALVFQFRARRYVPGVCWQAVVLISVVGTLLSNKPVADIGVPLQTSTITFAILLAITFAAWFGSERTLFDPHDRDHPPRDVLLADDPLHVRPRHVGR